MLAYKVESNFKVIFLSSLRQEKKTRERKRKKSFFSGSDECERKRICMHSPFLFGLETRETEKLWSESARDGDEYICEGKIGRKRGEEGGGGIQGMKEEFENIIETKSEIMKLEEEES
uniref:Uncharacterized protein n=1 Tax=Cacopsylla melanoneura TaxID=428564 RepID=A0A8D8RMA3_9HEMI